MAKINYMVGEAAVALSFQHKAVLVYERVLGVDHPETLTSYINLAIYCHNTNQTSVALRLMYRARYLLTVSGEGRRGRGGDESGKEYFNVTFKNGY